MKLGDAFEIFVRTRHLDQSVKYYKEKLGFENFDEKSSPSDQIKLTDGVIVLSLEPADEWQAGLTYFTEDLAGQVAALEREGIPVVKSREDAGRLTQAFITDPSGVRVNLEEVGNQQLLTGEKQPRTELGQFGEFSIETDDVQKSLNFWLKLGFKPTQYMPAQPASWASIEDGVVVVGIYQKGHTKHLFKTPSITYFEADMPARLQRLKQKGIAFAQELPGDGEEIGHGILEGPEGTLFFLFGF